MENQKSIREELKAFYRYIHKYRSLYAVGIVALIIVDVLEVFPALLLKRGVDSLEAGTASLTTLMQLAALYMTVALVQAFMRYLWRMFIVRTSMRAGDDMRREFFAHLSALAPAFFKRRRVGELVSLQSNDIQNVRFVLGPMILVFCDAIFYLLSIVPVMIWLSPKLAMLALIPLIFVTPFVLFLEKKIQAHFTTVQERFSDLGAESQESLGGVRVIKGAGLESLKEESFEKLGIAYRDANIRSALSQTVLNVGLNFFVSAAITLLFVVGGSLVIGETVTIGTFVAFHLYIQKMTWPMEALGQTMVYFQRGIASQRRLGEILREQNPLQEGVVPGLAIKAKIPRIEVKNLRFRYPGQSLWALDDISLSLEPGTRIGLAGRIGSGKSTLLHCLAKLEPVSNGMIFIDGHDINEFSPAEVHRMLAMVPQDCFLFSDSVTDNLLYGSPYFELPAQARLERAREVARIAHVHNEIECFSSGFDTLLGERGVNVSGGQKQRITIARALAQEPRVLFFDDCLSAVDSITEKKLTDSFERLARERSFIFASHRVSSLQNLDRVIVLEQGRIAESGRAEELLRADGFYRALVDSEQKSAFLGIERGPQNAHS
jgi:ATP-binding cassette subfamily B multidrug efflux pump